MHPTPVESSQVKRVAVHMQCCVPNSNVKKLNKNDVCGRMGDIAHRIVTTHLILFEVLGLIPPAGASSSTTWTQTSKSSPLTAYLLQEAGFGEPWDKE